MTMPSEAGLRWMAPHRYLELGDLQSLVSILIGLNLASPLFLGVPGRSSAAVKRRYDTVTRGFKALWKTWEKSGSELSEVPVDPVDRRTEALMDVEKNLLKQVSAGFEKMFEALDDFEDQLAKHFPWLMLCATAQFTVLWCFQSSRRRRSRHWNCWAWWPRSWQSPPRGPYRCLLATLGLCGCFGCW